MPENPFPNFPGPVHESQRGYFSAALYEEMLKNKDIWLITFDLGYKVFDYHLRDFSDRAKTVGASEAAGMGVAVGLALEGKRVLTYTITSFYLRCAETIALYVAGEGIPVRMVGSGVDDDYKHDGPSHHGRNAQNFIGSLGIRSYYPGDKIQVPEIVSEILDTDKPSFLALKR